MYLININVKKYFYDRYRKFAKNIKNNNFYILSGRYKFLTSYYKYIYKDISEKLSIDKSDDIFDIGTGDGKIIEHLSKKCKSSTTIDSKEVINSIPHKKITYLKGIFIKGEKILRKDLIKY